MLRVADSAQPPRLSALSHGAGCACKIGPEQLSALLDLVPRSDDPNLLVGAETSDDAAVYRLSDALAIVHTVDFFTPIVDEPYDFGRIAAANALSDVYAMGAQPVLALNLVAFSLDDLGADILGDVLRGGADVASSAGVMVAGGHSIDDHEPKYGMAVLGTVDPDRLITNAGARAGDVLLLTKPIGAGVITTATKRGLASSGQIAAAVGVMTELNRDASRAAVEAGVHGMTDVTGFGLVGHLHELCLASGVAAEVDAAAVPVIEGAAELAADRRCIAGGTRRNEAFAARFIRWTRSVPPARRKLLCDAMTSGGLLLAAPDHASTSLPGQRIGRLMDGEPGTVTVI